MKELEKEARKLNIATSSHYLVQNAVQVASFAISSSKLSIQHAPLAAAQVRCLRSWNVLHIFSRF